MIKNGLIAALAMVVGSLLAAALGYPTTALLMALTGMAVLLFVLLRG